MHALHFCPGLNYLDWEIDICEASTGFAMTAVTPAPAPAPAPALAGPAPPTSVDIAAAVVTVVTAAMAAAPAPTPPPLVQKLNMIFNLASLPAEARECYDDKVQGKLLTNKIHTPYRTANAYNELRHQGDSAMVRLSLMYQSMRRWVLRT